MKDRLWKLGGALGILAIVTGCSKSIDGASNLAETAANQATPATAGSKFRMTDFQQLDGTPYLLAPIYVATGEQRQSISKQLKSSIYSGSYDTSIDIRNYMFVHRDNLSAQKLLANNNTRILELEQLSETIPLDKSGKKSTPSSRRKISALWDKTVSTDTNNDKILDNRDRQSIAISDVSGAKYTEIIQNINKIISVYPNGTDRLLVIYTSGSKHFAANINISNRTATIEPLPSVN